MNSERLQAPGRDQVVLPENEVLRLNDWAESAAWVFAVVAALAGALLAFTDPSPGSDITGPIRFVMAVIWFAFAFVFGSSARAGLVINGDNLEVRWRIRSRVVSWQDIATFELQRSAFRPPLRMKLQTGEELRVPGFEARSSGDSDRAKMMVAELNRRVGGSSP